MVQIIDAILTARNFSVLIQKMIFFLVTFRSIKLLMPQEVINILISDQNSYSVAEIMYEFSSNAARMPRMRRE